VGLAIFFSANSSLIRIKYLFEKYQTHDYRLGSKSQTNGSNVDKVAIQQALKEQRN
jgi:hypothetical protein